MASASLKLGGASGFWGEANHATEQLLDGGVDVLVYDYLAEITMAILARMKALNPDAGFATDFVTGAMAPNLTKIARNGVKVVSNAGGVNPEACAAAVRALISEAGLNLRVTAVLGDDLMDQRDRLAAAGIQDMFTGATFPDPAKVRSINAYLGAFSIAQALADGADIVITGRCVDSAVTLGPLIHHFGWRKEDLDLLSAGSLIGHLIECGPQATGGNFTDWEDVPDRANIGYPIAEVRADGIAIITKPAGTGGLVSAATVAEQLVYEIGDPAAYLLPDVTCDWTEASLEQVGANQVRVAGAKGMPAPTDFKVCLTYEDGFRGGHTFGFYGANAKGKAEAFAEAALTRADAALLRANLDPFSQTSVEILGSETQFGAGAKYHRSREVQAKIAVRHPSAAGVELMLKEATGLTLSAPPGLSGFAGTRPKPSPVLALFSFLLAKDLVQPGARPTNAIDGDGKKIVPQASDLLFPTPEPADDLKARPGSKSGADRTVITDWVEVSLIELAYARSGDKGDRANVGVIARDPAFLPYIAATLTEDRIMAVFAHFNPRAVDRFYLQGLDAMNIVIHDVLGGGGTSSLRSDPQAKGYSQILLAEPIAIPATLLNGA